MRQPIGVADIPALLYTNLIANIIIAVIGKLIKKSVIVKSSFCLCYISLSYFRVYLLKNGADRHHNPARLTTASNHLRGVCANGATLR